LLRPARDYGESEAKLLARLRQEGNRELAAPSLVIALRELADRSWVSSFASPLSGKRWRITALGLSVLEEEGLGQS
jgi:hypothetical protein